jgi:tRNA-Thr(GGU) m(6)t(6)A37 methyltransferase TsaA
MDPDARPDAHIAFIGRVRSPWGPDDCPKNLRRARESGKAARLEIDPVYGQGLIGLKVGSPIIVLYWMDRSRRDLIVQRPGHSDGLRGVFAIRSPVRPNPVALAAVTITAIDPDAGRIDVDAIDCFDGTPLIDIKPWLPTIDIPPGQTPSTSDLNK